MAKSTLVRRIAVLLMLLLAAACSTPNAPQDDGDGKVADDKKNRQVTIDPDKPAKRLPSKPKLSKVEVRLQPLADLVEPTSMAVREGDDGIYVTERPGRIRVVRDGQVKTLLDWRKHTKGGNEQGMLGLTFSPDGERLYVYYIEKITEHSRLDEYTMNGETLDESSRREVLLVDQPEDNLHKGGQLAFGDDGMLYLSLGDGGPSDEPPNTSQEMDTLLGKLIRIDPRPDGKRGYSIPQDNPFVGEGNAKGEIFAMGLRNPWRYSFDRETGDLWLADVGRYIIEEINYRPAGNIAGSNFGWPMFEGTSQQRSGDTSGLVEPLHVYPHEGRCAVVGGYVYRGTAIPKLRGAYVYGDYCDGKVRALVRKKKDVKQEAELGIATTVLTSFGQDQAGELYVLSLEEGLSKIVPAD